MLDCGRVHDRTCGERVLRVSIRPLLPDDWPHVEAIYREGIDGGNATFETEPPSWTAFDSSRRRDARLVAVDELGAVRGWAAASPVSSRAVYRGVVEHSVYVATSAHGQGIGRALLRALLDATERAGCWTVQASIFPENTASLALHESEGFRTVGRREAIALMTTGPHAGEWRDTLLVERRSASRGRGAASAA